MRGDEARVIEAFCAWLQSQGWSTECEVKFVDVLARRAGVTMYAEAKGRTAALGLDVDTLYGQLLRRMPIEDATDTVFAVVVPDEAVQAAVRVPARVRQALRIAVYAVSTGGTVREV